MFGIPSVVLEFHRQPLPITRPNSTVHKDFCPRHHIEKRFVAVTHLQEIGQVEAVNMIIKSILKKRLEKANGKWVDEFPLLLWAFPTTHKSATDNSQFAAAYGSEAMISIKLELPSHRVTHYNLRTNEQLIVESLGRSAMKLTAAHQHQVGWSYNAKTRNQTYEIDTWSSNESSLALKT